MSDNGPGRNQRRNSFRSAGDPVLQERHSASSSRVHFRRFEILPLSSPAEGGAHWPIFKISMKYERMMEADRIF